MCGRLGGGKSKLSMRNFLFLFLSGGGDCQFTGSDNSETFILQTIESKIYFSKEDRHRLNCTVLV